MVKKKKSVGKRKNSKRQNKRGAEMTIGTIIVIILALVVLVVIIFGFTTGWGNLWQRLTGFAPKANVQTIVQSCQLACTQQSTYDYCGKPRNVTYKDDQKVADSFMNCQDFANRKGPEVGLERCSNIDCNTGTASGLSQPCMNSNIWIGNWIAGDKKCEDETQVDITGSSLLLSSDKQDHPNQKCCINKLGACPNSAWVTPDKNCDAGYVNLADWIAPAAKSGNEGNKCCVKFN